MKNLTLLMAGLLSLLLLPAALLAQERAITGKVTDANGNPLPSVSVVVKQTNRGTATDVDGKFTISAPANGAIIISSTGYKSQTINVGSTTDLQVKLEDDIARLDEVIVTGLATSVKRRNLANTVATISSKQLAGVAPAQTFDAALNGKISGAYINANTGAPGGGLSVKLRGVTSIFGNTQPLYVVDGVFMDNTATSPGLNPITGANTGGNTAIQDNPSSRIADLRSEDIENIEILKGASAAAIYGSKAAAGVILITTKRGKQGATKISFSQDLGFIKVRRLLGQRPLSAAVVQSQQGWDINEYNAAAAAGKIYDYEKELYGNTGFTRNSILSMTGGSEKTSFYFSANTKSEEGIIARTGYKATGMRLNIDHRINDNIKIGVTTNYVNSSANRGLTGNDNNGVTFGIALSSTPGFTELHPDANGVYPRNKYAASNPLETRDKMRNNESVNRFVTGVNLDATLFRGSRSSTKFIARGGVDFYNLLTDGRFPSTLQFQTVAKGTSIQGTTKSLNTNLILSLVNNYSPSDKLSLTTSAGVTQETGDYNNLVNVATQVISGQSNVDQAGALTATQFRTKNQDNGFFIQEEATISEALSLNAGIRFDRSSNNGDPEKFYTYPKAGVSWNLTKMGFWSGSFFDNFKVRAAYGQAGNFPAYGSKFTSLAVSNITGFPGSVVNIQRGEAAIRPERQTEFETGFDFTIFGGRLSAEFTYYNKTITDFLLQNTLPSSSGFTTQWVNAGDLRNQGVEIGFTGQPVASKNVTWNSTLNFWFNRSEVTELTIPPVVLGSFGVALGTFQIEEGKSATQIIGLTDEPGFNPPIKVWGDQEPRFQMNSFNEITFKNRLSLRFLMHWKYKGFNVNLTNLLNDLGGTSADFDEDENKNGTPDGVDRINKVGSTAVEFVQNAGYFRVRELGLYYSFPNTGINFIKGLRVGISLNNYITVTKYEGYDPEVSNFGTGFSTGIDVDPFPASKRAAFHLTVDF